MRPVVRIASVGSLVLICAIVGSCACELRAEPASPPSGEMRVTDDGFLKSDLFFWPTSNDLLYTVERADGNMRIVRQSVGTQEVTLFQSDAGISDREVVASNDGQIVAYNVVSGLSSRILVVDKQRDRQLTMPQMGRHPWANWPCISPDGTQLLYVEGAKVIYAYDLVLADGKASVTRLTTESIGPASDYWPRFTPDGQSILFGSSRDDDFEIYLMKADGTNPQRLTTSPGLDMRPVSSPDGSRICFTSNRDGNYEIYVMESDGSNVQRLTHNPERDDYAIWSPDGQQIVYVSERQGRFDIWRMPAR